MEKLLKTVLKEIKPSEKEEKEMKAFISLLLDVSEKHSKIFDARPMLCGSVAKGTWVSNHREVDVFLLFKGSLPREKLEEYGLKLAKDIISELKGRYRKAYTEHPYLCGLVRHGDRIYDLDLVPCYDTPPQNIKSAVDRTPHHVKYIKENISGLEDEVRLFKQFCKASDCYGADLRYQGFSGYLCELLILKYRSFLDAVKNISKWHAGIVIDIENKSKPEEARKKFRNPLIVIDPVDKERNVSAAVSVETFYRFVKACQGFLKYQSKKSFFKELAKPYSVDEIRKEMKTRGSRLYLIRFYKPRIAEDILYSQLRKCVDRIESLLEENDFSVLRTDFYLGEACVLMFEMENWVLPKIAKHFGPEVYARHAMDFLKHYKGEKLYIKDEKWAVEYRREFSNALEFFRNLFSKHAGELKAIGIPGSVAESVEKKCEIYSGHDALRLIARLSEDFRVFLREYFEKDLNVSD